MNEKVHIQRCLNDIEHKLQWASRDKWVYEDFKHLQDLIFDASSISLSVHTLERLFGKLKTQENYNPQTETKNALALFLGYKSWNHYKSENKIVGQEHTAPDSLATAEAQQITLVSPPENTDTSGPTSSPEVDSRHQNRKKKRLYATLVVAMCSCVGLALFYFFANPTSKVIPAISFKASNPYGRIPHTAKFAYDGLSPKTTSLHVDFGEGGDWEINENQSSFFKTYMTPGIFNVSLKQDSQVLAKTNVFIATDGWQGYTYTTYEDNKTRRLLPNSVLCSEGKLHTSSTLITDTLKKGSYYFIEYNRVDNFRADGDNLTFDTRFRSNVQNGGTLCNDMWFKLTGTQGVLKMHFLVVGCSGYIQMIFGDQNLDGRVQDLSAFTRNFSDWKTARMKVVNKQVSIFFDEKLIYQTHYKTPVGDVMAISITSKGSGETDYVRLYDRTMKLAFTDDFR